MNLFSISELQQFSGVKAHTIRIWEQRYNALKPERTEGNTRFYSAPQLRRLLNIVSLMNENYKISELCSMPDEKLYELLDIHLTKNISPDYAIEYLISQCIAASMEFNEEKFDKLFSNSILRFGLKGTYLYVIYPTLVRLGIMWTNDSLPPAQEHFITSLIRQKLLSAIDSIPPAVESASSWILFLPENEFHETGLLLANFLIRQLGMKVIYLGGNVPFNSLKLAVKQVKPTHILFFMVRKNDSKDESEFISKLDKNFTNQQIFFSCDSSRLNNLKTNTHFTKLHSVQDLENELQLLNVQSN